MPETYNSDGVECPYCGYVDRDSWELDGEDGEQECGRCEKTYKWSRNTSVTYSASEIKPKQPHWNKLIPYEMD